MLVEVRCPHFIEVQGKKRKCNFLRVKVEPGSKGEAYCPNCKKPFKFAVSNSYELPVREQKYVTVKSIT